MCPLSSRTGTRETLYDASATEANAFATSLKSGFEGALAETLGRLPSHGDLARYATRTGHRTRPVGCLLSCAAVGGDWRMALDAAVAVELIHKSSVIRDDMMDDDSVRSGQPAFHVVFGAARAIAVSDLLWTLGLRQFSAFAAGPIGEACLRASANALHEMAAGQLEDIAPSPDRKSLAARRLVDERKTGVLSELSCRLGALVGGGCFEQVDALAGYGLKLGTAFQVLNDVRNLRGDETSRGAASDLRKRRDTLLSAYVREQGDATACESLAALTPADGDLPEAEVEALRRIMLDRGAAEYGEQVAAELMGEARECLRMLPESLAKEILESLAREALLAYAF